jgi:uncharacterized protein (DUF1697 family)
MKVVFLRAANVGGKNVFRPAQLAKALAHLDVVNIGAAGTFVIRERVSLPAARAAILEQLPFAPSMVIRPAGEIVALVESEPFRGVRFSKDLRGWIAALERTPSVPPRMPLHAPDADVWGMRLDRVDGAFALGLWRRRPDGFVMPSNAIEKALGVSATVRWWETFQRIAKVVGG